MTTQHKQNQSEEKSANAKTEEFKAAIEADLLEFGRRKEALLTKLRDAHNDGPKSEPFNEAKWSYYLTDFARIFFSQARLKSRDDAGCRSGGTVAGACKGFRESSQHG